MVGFLSVSRSDIVLMTSSKNIEDVINLF